MGNWDASKHDRGRGGKFTRMNRNENDVDLGVQPRSHEKDKWVSVDSNGDAVFTGAVDLSQVPSGNHDAMKGNPNFTDHSVGQIKAKGVPPENVIAALRDPYKVTDVLKYPGQVRYCGYGVAVIVEKDTRLVRTVYADGVRTRLREDQRSDPDAMKSKRLFGQN